MGTDVHLSCEQMDGTMIWWLSPFNDIQHIIYDDVDMHGKHMNPWLHPLLIWVDNLGQDAKIYTSLSPKPWEFVVFA